MKWYFHAFIFLIAGVSGPSHFSHAETNVSINVNADCLSRINEATGSTQDCVEISALKIKLDQSFSEKVHAFLTIDPLGTPVSSLKHIPRGNWIKLPTYTDIKQPIVDDFKIQWLVRDNLTLAIENFEGTTSLPKFSGLPLASRFQDTGWDQLAITARYRLNPLEGIDVLLAIGNGEGEKLKNLDPQQYGGIKLTVYPFTGMFFSAGLSLDGNNIGSEQYQWLYKSTSDQRGFSTERQALALGLDGSASYLAGFKFSIGLQQSRLTDLDQARTVLPKIPVFQEDSYMDVNNVLAESKDSTNQIKRDIFDISASYRIVDTYELGINFEKRTIDTSDTEAFTICKTIESGECSAGESTTNKLTQTAYSLGVSKHIDQALSIGVTYHNSFYDKLYRYFNHLGSNDEKVKSWEVVNIRIAYSW